LGSRRVSIVGILVIIVAASGFLFIRNLIDFPVYYAAGRSLLSGRTDLYAPDFARGLVMDYRYPPLFLLLLTPLWVLPYAVAAFAWHLVSTLEIFGCAAVLRRVMSAPRLDLRVWVFAFLSVAQYFVMILHYGNAHLLVVFLLFGGLFFYVRGTKAAGAFLMALSITIKLTPMLLLPYFVVRREWRFLGFVIGFVALMNLAPALYFGLERNAELLKEWSGHVVVDQEFHEVNGPINLSLRGQLRRYLTRVDYGERIEGDTRYPAVNLASFSSSTADWAWRVLTAGFFGTVLLLVWWSSRGGLTDPNVADAGADEVRSLEIALMISLMLLVGPLTSKIYFIALLWPIVCLGRAAFSNGDRSSRFTRGVLYAVAVVNCVLPLLPGRTVQRLLLAVGADFYVNLVVLVATGCLLMHRRSVHPRSVERQKPDRSTARAS
jgi:Glycosyltransferase family 87